MRTFLPDKLKDFPKPDETAATNLQFTPDEDITGLWKGYVHTYNNKIPLALDIRPTGNIHTTMGDQPTGILRNVSYQNKPHRFKNVGGGYFLRGWIQGDLETSDVKRGRPSKLWLELKLRNDVLNGSLIVFSQRKLPTGPLTHWVELKKQ